MFENCSSLLNLPDISKWNTANILNMSNLFHGASSLITLLVFHFEISGKFNNDEQL